MLAHCKIEDGVAELNGNRIDYTSHNGANWKKNLYNHLKLDYPKFFKMDDLSKLSLLCMELLKTTTHFDESELSMIFANRSASTFTDNKFRSSLDKGMPSPSLFVYTLPNVSVGELTIKHSFHGSSSFYITDTLSDLPIQELLHIEFNKGYTVVIIGWVEKSKDEDCGLCFIFDNHSTKEDLALIRSFSK